MVPRINTKGYPRPGGMGLGGDSSWPVRSGLDENALPAGFTQIPAWDTHQLSNMPGQSLKATPALTLRQIGVTGRPMPLNAGVPSLWKHYKANEMVFACVEIKASSAINPRLKVEERSGKGEYQEQAGHPFRQLMMRPNPTMDEAGFARAFFTSTDVAGKFYAEITRNERSNLADGLYPLDPAKVSEINGPEGVEAYEFRDGMFRTTIPAANMLVHRAYDPQNRLQGMSKLAVALGSVDADSAQTEYIREFFNNGGIPSGLLKIKKRLSDAQSAEIAAKWHKRYGRATGKQHSVAVMDEDADYQKVGASLDELESQSIRALTESRICMVFQIPPLIIYSYTGLLRATYSNLKEAWDNYWRGTLTVAYTEYKNWLTWALLPQFVSEDRIKLELIRLEWDMSKVPYLQESQELREARAMNAFQAGGITLNEYRAAIGMQPDPAGDYYLRLFNRVPVPFGDNTNVDLASLLNDPSTVSKVEGKALLHNPMAMALLGSMKARITRQAVERAVEALAKDHIQGDWQAIENEVRQLPAGREE